MNPGVFTSSGSLSWAMYLMRKGQTGTGLFGKAHFLDTLQSPSPLNCPSITSLPCRFYVLMKTFAPYRKLCFGVSIYCTVALPGTFRLALRVALQFLVAST